MIRTITSYHQCRDFAECFRTDPHFSDPMFISEEQIQHNLIAPINNQERFRVLGVFQGEQMTGLFSFLVMEEEHLLEMLVGLSREEDAYREILQYLQQYFPGYGVDFVFNPENHLLKNLLSVHHADFDPEQKKMVLMRPFLDWDTSGVELLCHRYTDEYCRIHSKDVYWTGEKLVQAQDRFHTFLAICEGKVAGYLDLSRNCEENEIYDLLVLQPYRRKGFARKLLAKAQQVNHPNGMMLLVDTDNIPAIRLYEAMGFDPVAGENSINAHWTVTPACPSE